MPRPLPTVMQVISELSHNSSPWIWLLRVQAQTDPELPPVVIPLTTHSAEVTWPPTGPDAETFYPYAWKFGSIEETSEGDLPQLDLTFDNSTRVLMGMAHQVNGFEGADAKLVLINSATLAIDTEFLEWDFVVASSTANAKAFQVRLEMRNFFQVQLPSDRYVANRCRRQFGGKHCGYVVNEVAAFQTCDKTLTACVAHGDDEVARNLPRLHPLRYGGFRGIAIGRQQ